MPQLTLKKALLRRACFPLYLLLLLVLTGCQDQLEVDHDILPESCVVDLNEPPPPNYYRPEFFAFAVPGPDFRYGACTRYYPRNIDRYFRISSAQLCVLEMNFKKLENRVVDCCCCDGCNIFDLDLWTYYYLGMEIKGVEYVYVVGIYRGFWSEEELEEEWKREVSFIPSACDGGLFGVQFNPETEEFSYLSMESRLWGSEPEFCFE